MKNEVLSFIKKHPLAIILLTASILYIIWTWSPLGLIHSWNESYYMIRTAHMVQGGSFLDGIFDNPPLFFYSLVLLSKIFGTSLILFRLFIVFCTLATVYLVYKIGENFGGKKIAIVSSASFAFFPMIVIFSKIIQIDIFAIMLMTASFYFVVLGVKFSKSWFLLSGLFLGLAVLTKLPAGLVILPIFYYMYLNKTKIKYFLEIVIVTAIFQMPWVVYVLLTKPSFFRTGASSSSNFFGLGSMHNDAPYYELAMVIFSIFVFVSLIILFLKHKPRSAGEKTLAIFSLVFSGFFLLLPNHEYYLLPVFAPLFLFIGIAYSEKRFKVIKKILIVFLVISTILVAIRPMYDVNWEEALEFVEESNMENATIYSANPLVAEYYAKNKVDWLNPDTLTNISKNNTIIMFTCYDKINLQGLGLMEIIENNFVFLKDINGKIFIYGSKDLASGI